MKYKKILISGGAGFVGSNIALRLKKDYPQVHIVAFDNLMRKGSELNVPRLRQENIFFVRGDVRNLSDIEAVGEFDLIIECSAECSVLAGYGSSPQEVIDINLFGAVNCLEASRRQKADFIFLSTSRVYPIEKLNSLSLIEQESRFELDAKQLLPGVSPRGISEDFPLQGYRSFYGTSKLAAEALIEEYIRAYGMRAVINRCGVIAGPWQMGKIDQGVITLWVARHIYGLGLSYIGFGGKQVRDVLHVDDLYRLLELQLENIEKYSGQVFNVGGGIAHSISLRELTALCEKITGQRIKIATIDEVREADIPYYVTDFSKISAVNGWKPLKGVQETVEDTAHWIFDNKNVLESVFT